MATSQNETHPIGGHRIFKRFKKHLQHILHSPSMHNKERIFFSDLKIPIDLSRVHQTQLIDQENESTLKNREEVGELEQSETFLKASLGGYHHGPCSISQPIEIDCLKQRGSGVFPIIPINHCLYMLCSSEPRTICPWYSCQLSALVTHTHCTLQDIWVGLNNI